MNTFITDRERDNVLRRIELAAKGFPSMTEAERTEWLGDPFLTEGANLFPPDPCDSSDVALIHKDNAIIAKALAAGSNLYAASIVGVASRFEGKTFTFSFDSIASVGGGTPLISLYWHDDSGCEYAGASLAEAGSVTFTISENSGNRAYLAAYVYVTTDTEVEEGAAARFGGVMLEVGETRHKYVPYMEIVPTRTTKGAYNYADLNRVERAAAFIASELGLSLITKTDWTLRDIPRASDMERYLNNIKTIRDAVSSTVSLPDSMNELTYSGANNIEKVLIEAYSKIGSSVRCGELYCGEV